MKRLGDSNCSALSSLFANRWADQWSVVSGQWSAVIADEPPYALSRAEPPTGRRRCAIYHDMDVV